MGIVLFPFRSTQSASDDSLYADCTYYPLHKESFLSNDAKRDREMGRIALALKRFP